MMVASAGSCALAQSQLQSPSSSLDLSVAREGILFHNLTPDLVLIEIEVSNEGDSLSEPTTLHLETAPFGAFLPWQPLATLSVPAIPPQDTARVRTVARQLRGKLVASSSELVPRGSLAPSGTGEGPPRPRESRPSFRGLLGALMGGAPDELLRDVQDFFGERGSHWMGNLNVWIGDQPVERHRAPRLRVYPSKTNLAMFFVGGPNAYKFRVDGHGVDWKHKLVDTDSALSVPDVESYHEGAWYDVELMAILVLALQPPVPCHGGQVDVHVIQRSSGSTAVVEFDLDPEADGPGCYTV